ncbi:MAG: HAD family hydrolase [Anaerolineae bacterium]|nr:HAD family hydrolase [Anaerolineae bacterium]
MCDSSFGRARERIRLALPGRQVACRAIIFDKDGTLVDPTGFQSRLLLTRSRALRVAAETSIGPLQGASSDPLRRQAGNRPGNPATRSEESRENQSVSDRHAPVDPPSQPEPDGALGMGDPPLGATLLPGVADMLEIFRGLGLRLAIATGDRRRRAEATMDALGVGECFSAIVGIDDVARGKPAPDMVDAACARLGCLPEEVVVVGDSPADLMMGRAAGVAACIGVTNGLGSSERLGALADAVLHSVAELPSLVVCEE